MTEEKPTDFSGIKKPVIDIKVDNIPWRESFKAGDFDNPYGYKHGDFYSVTDIKEMYAERIKKYKEDLKAYPKKGYLHDSTLGKIVDCKELLESLK